MTDEEYAAESTKKFLGLLREFESTPGLLEAMSESCNLVASEIVDLRKEVRHVMMLMLVLTNVLLNTEMLENIPPDEKIKILETINEFESVLNL